MCLPFPYPHLGHGLLLWQGFYCLAPQRILLTRHLPSQSVTKRTVTIYIFLSQIRECLEHSTAPMDGNTLAEALHSRGINIRYLGLIARRLASLPSLSYLHSITVIELVTRGAKHVYNRVYIQPTQLLCLAPAAAHFLNCLLCSVLTGNSVQDEVRV